MIVGCGDLTILLVGLGFHCFLLKCKEKLRHSLGRPSRSDFAMYIRKPRILGAVLVEARSMTYGDLGAKALLSVLVVVSH